MTIKAIIKKIAFTLGFDSVKLRSIAKCLKRKHIAYNVNNSNCKKRALFLYITAPFFSIINDDRHQNIWQAKEMARIIGTYGYCVDIVDFDNPYVRLKHDYDLVVGLIPRGVDIYSKHLNKDCIIIAYLTSMNLEISALNERLRIDAVNARRGCNLPAVRDGGKISKIIETYDAVWYIGNEYNYKSYSKFQMPPVSYIKNSGYDYPWAYNDVARNPKHFLFLGSWGQVHKGLDLLLELFSNNLKDLDLFVCGPYINEKEFCKEYEKELFHKSNIHAIGFVDIHSNEFKRIAQDCAFMVFPSCAEGCAGSVITAMSAGMIPIVSRECGFNDDEAIMLPDCKKDTIEKYLREYSQKEDNWIKEQSRKSVNISKERYSREMFTKSVNNAMKDVLERDKRC